MNMGTTLVRRLVINADDLGASTGVNDGIVKCIDHGMVTSASLMVNMPGALDAVERLRSRPHISIGIHVNLTNEHGPPIADFDDALSGPLP